MEFVLIPAGTFMMGSPDADQEAYDAEKPAHCVTISQPFYLGKYPVTQAQWEAVMGDNPSRFEGNSHSPVEYVSWYDVHEFLHKLNEQERRRGLPPADRSPVGICVPCRDGTPRYHHDVHAIAWYEATSNSQPHPVGRKLPNAWGLYDMLGNVWEWCHDGRRTYTADAAVDPVGPTGVGADRVVRGGSWADPARRVRAAPRSWVDPGFRYDFLGFRCASSGRWR